MSLPSGFSCPAALNCLAKADRKTGKISDGPEQEYRCYAASQEARHLHIRKLRWNNFQLLRGRKQASIARKLIASLQPMHDAYVFDHGQPPIIRAHIGGDFFNEAYFLAWLELAQHFSKCKVYSYTKRLDLWTKHLDEIPPNFQFNASYGGKFDHLIEEFDLKYAKVVLSHEEAEALALPIDKDDSLAYAQPKPFAQLIHGTQKAKSKASKALATLKKVHNWTGYNQTTKQQLQQQ